MSSTSVLDIILAFFLGGAVAAAVGLVLGFNAWCFRFLASGIIFEGNMSAILGLN
jgi:ABC-type nitrate/sulfonate/bicarbonate transport system permease component